MSNGPFFSIIVPVYNTESYLGRCIESILNQSFSDYEIIIVNDGSTDNSEDIAAEYAQKDFRIKLIHKANGGVSSARNCGIYNSTGKYLYFIDSDDVLCEKALDNAYNCIIKENYPDILQARHKRIIGNDCTEYQLKIPDKELFDDKYTKDEKLINVWCSTLLPDLIPLRFLKSEFIKNNGLSFNINYVYQEDGDFTFNMYRKVENIAYGDFFIFTYFKGREGSLTSTRSDKSYKSEILRWINFYNELKYYDASEEIKSKVIERKKQFTMQLRSFVLYSPLYRNKEATFEFIDLIAGNFKKEIKKLPIKPGLEGLAFLMQRIIGFKNTARIVYIIKIFKK